MNSNTGNNKKKQQELISCPSSSHADLEIGTDTVSSDHPWVHRHTRLWYEHVIYTREVVKSRLLNLSDEKVQTERLLRNQSDLVASLSAFLSTYNQNTYKDLLVEHITIAVELVDAASGQSTASVKDIRARWDANGVQIRDLLHKVQRNRVRFLQDRRAFGTKKNAWCPNKLLDNWKIHLDQTQAEAVALIGKDWKAANVQFDLALAHMGEYGVRLAKGFLFLWPENKKKLLLSSPSFAPSTSVSSSLVGNFFGGAGGRGTFYARNPTEYPPDSADPGFVRYVPEGEMATETFLTYPADRRALMHVIRSEPVAVVLHVAGSQCVPGGDCDEAARILSRLGAEMEDVVFIYNDVEKQVREPDVTEFPTIHVYRDGGVVAIFDGLQSEDTYRDAIMHAVEGDEEDGCLEEGDGTGAGPGAGANNAHQGEGRPEEGEQDVEGEEEGEEEEEEVGEEGEGEEEDIESAYYRSFVSAENGAEMVRKDDDGLYYPTTPAEMQSLRNTFKILVVIYGIPRCKYSRKGVSKMRRLGSRYRTDPDVAFVYFNVGLLSVDSKDRDAKGYIRVPYYRLISNRTDGPKFTKLDSLSARLAQDSRR